MKFVTAQELRNQMPASTEGGIKISEDLAKYVNEKYQKEKIMSEERSEFGKGFTYCIGLFLMHAERSLGEKGEHASIWFNGASDHLYELKIPDNFVDKDACEGWRDTVLSWGHGPHMMEKRSKEDVGWALDKAKEFLIAWDKQCGVETEKGQWE